MFQNNLLMAAASTASAAGYTVDYSCRFNTADTAVLSRANGTATSSKIATIAFWFKVGVIGVDRAFFGAEGFYTGCAFLATGQLYVVHGSAGAIVLTTTQVFRDPSAWYHCMCVFDTTESVDTDRFKLYINGAQVTDYTAGTFPTLNEAFTAWNTSGNTNLVADGHSTYSNYDGYLAEFHSTDGTAYTPTTFGEFDDYGVWRPIEVTGVTYGNNGFYFDFADSADLGNDVSGNDNDFTSSGLVAADQMTDTPTKNFSTLNSAQEVWTAAVTLSDGNLHGAGTAGTSTNNITATIAVSSGKWVFASKPTAIAQLNADLFVCNDAARNTRPTSAHITAGCWTFTWQNTTLITTYDQTSTTNRTASPAVAVGDYQLCALDVDNLAIWFGIYDASAGTTVWTDNSTGFTGDPTDGGTTKSGTLVTSEGDNFYMGASFYTGRSGDLDFGQGALLSDITIPTGFKLVNTANIAAPTILDGTENFQTTLYQGTGVARTVGQQSNSYYNMYGSGDRVNIIASSGVGGAYNNASPVGILVNGVTTAASGPGIDTFATDMNWKFVFSQAVNITEVLIDMQSAGGNLGDSWLWEGSNNDFSSTTALSGTIDISSNTDPEIQTLNLIGASDTYKYYRLRNTNGNGGNSTTWDEFNFKVAPLNALSTFQPDMVWIKNRSQADNNMLFDAPRGVTEIINPNEGVLPGTDANSLTSFDADGFGLGTGAGGFNDNLESFVAWQWLAGGGAGSANAVGSITTTTTTVNTTAGISIGTYVGTGVAGETIGHGLGAVPEMMVLKNTDSAENWRVYHKDNTTAPETEYLSWQTNAATVDLNTTFNDTAPTSTVFTVGASANTNENTKTIVCYIFTGIEGFSKFSNYTGNGLADGTYVYTGFKPAYVMIKKTSGTGAWVMYDSQRSPYNEIDDQLLVNTAAAETTGSEEIDFLSNGFKIRTADSAVNTSSGNYIYAAFAQYPFGGDGATPATAF